MVSTAPTFAGNTDTRLAIPHSNNEDQFINGYFIPKGSIINPNYGTTLLVLVNCKAHQVKGGMLVDKKIWDEPEVFKPERFLGPDAHKLPNPLTVNFGFGPRICPGMWFADRVAFHLGITAMALFDIKPLEGESIPKVDEIEYTKEIFK